MNEYEKAFYEDVKEKKTAATGAFHRATRGKKSFAVHNQSDYLSKKELKAMSGEVSEFNLKKPMRWNQYQLLDNPAKKLYLETLVEEYNPKATGLMEMFGMSHSTARNELDKYGLSGNQGTRRTAEEKKRWKDFLNNGAVEPDIPKIVYDDTCCVAGPPLCNPAPKPPGMLSAKMELVGTDKDKVVADMVTIINLVGAYGKVYKITLEVEQ